MANGKKFLIAGDSLFIRTTLKNILLPYKYGIIKADTGTQTLRAFKKEKPDLILLDIIMPDKDGVEVLQEILKTDPHAKVIMVIAVGQDKMMNKCKKMGAVDYIIKSFDKKQISSVIEKHLRGKENKWKIFL